MGELINFWEYLARRCGRSCPHKREQTIAWQADMSFCEDCPIFLELDEGERDGVQMS